MYHLVRRVSIDRQWANGTTAAGYLADMRRAVGSTDARLCLYERRGGLIAATITPTTHVLEERSRGEKAEPQFLVVYAVDRGTIISGYLFTAFTTVAIPGDALWLK